MSVDAGSIYSEVRLKLEKLAADINTVNSKIDMMYRNNEQKAGGFGSFWKGAFQTAFGFGTIQIIQKVITAVKDMIGIFSGYQQSMRNVQSVTGAVGKEFEQLQEAAKEAGETTRFTAREAADALYYLGSAGFSAQQSIQALDGVLQLAGATQSDLASTSETVASVISQYNLQAGEAGRISNVFAAAIGNSQATMDKLATSMRQVGPVAAGLGYSLEDTVGALQELYNAGFQGQQAGRALKSILADLASPTANIKNIMAKYNIELSKANPTMNDFADIIEVLAASGMTTADTLDAFGKVAGPQMAVLIQQGSEALRKYTKDVTDTNAAAEMYNIQNDSLAGSLDFLKSKLEGLAIAIFEKVEPGMRDLIDDFIQFIENMKPVGQLLGNIINLFLQFSSLPLKAFNTLFEIITNGFSNISGPMKEADRGLKSVSESIKRAGELGSTAKKLNDLTDEYEQLKSKTNLTKGEQDRLKAVIAGIQEIMPDAITQFDEYGNAIAVSGEKSKQAAKDLLLAKQATVSKALSELKASEAIYKNIIRENDTKVKNSEKERKRLISESAIAEARLATLQKFRTEYDLQVSKTDDLNAATITYNNVMNQMRKELSDVGLSFKTNARDVNDVITQLENMNKEAGKSEKTLNDLNRSLSKPTKAEKQYEEAKAKLEEIAKLEKELKNVQNEIKDTEKIDPVKKDAPETINNLKTISDEFWKTYNEEINRAVREASTFGGKQDELKAKLDFLKNAYLSLIDEGLDPAGLTLTRLKQEYDLTAIELQNLIDEEEAHEKQLKAQADAQENIQKIIKEYTQKTEELGKSKSELIEIERERALAEIRGSRASAEAVQQALDATNAYFDKLKENSEEVKTEYTDMVNTILEASSQLANALGSLFTTTADNRIEELDRQMQAELEAAGLSEETEKQRLERELEEAKKTGDKEKEQEVKKSLDRLAIEEKYEREKAQIQYKAELNAWYMKLLGATASGAQAIISGFATQPFIPAGLAAGALATALTGLQLLTVNASKPKPPAFDSGGVFIDNTAGSGGSTAVLHSPETILNGEQMAKVFDMINSHNVGNEPGQMQVTVIYNVDGITLAKIVETVANNGIIQFDPDKALLR